MKLDIGPESLEEVKQILNDAETVLWNGPPGVFEFEPFAVGTNAIAQAMADITSRGATTVIGGGDSVYAVTKLGLQEQVGTQSILCLLVCLYLSLLLCHTLALSVSHNMMRSKEFQTSRFFLMLVL